MPTILSLSRKLALAFSTPPPQENLKPQPAYLHKRRRTDIITLCKFSKSG
jgi:hypothetical protein